MYKFRHSIREFIQDLAKTPGSETPRIHGTVPTSSQPSCVPREKDSGRRGRNEDRGNGPLPETRVLRLPIYIVEEPRSTESRLGVAGEGQDGIGKGFDFCTRQIEI